VTIVRVGSNDKYASGWESAFGTKRKTGKKVVAASGGKKKPAKKKGKK
jgi:hypothetical protein